LETSSSISCDCYNIAININFPDRIIHCIPNIYVPKTIYSYPLRIIKSGICYISIRKACKTSSRKSCNITININFPDGVIKSVCNKYISSVINSYS